MSTPAFATLIKSAPALTVARPKFVRHPLVRPNTKFLFDFTDARCWPNGIIVPGALVAGAIFTDLAAGVTATVVGTGVSANSDGSLQFDGTSPVSGVRIGAAGQFDASAAPYKSLGGLWMKLPATGYTTTGYWAMMAAGSSYTDGQVNLDMGPGGVVPRTSIGTGTGGYTLATAGGTAITAGVVYQLSTYFEAGAVLTLGLNGALNNTSTSPPATLQPNAAPKAMMLINAGKFTCYGAFLHDIGASIIAETVINTALVAASKPPIASRTYLQHLLADYQFGTGALAPSAPKTAYA